MGQLDHAPARSRVHALPAHYTTTRERESARAMLCMNLSGHTVIARLQMRSKVNAASGRKAGAQAKKAAFARSDSLKMMAALERKSSYDENQKRSWDCLCALCSFPCCRLSSISFLLCSISLFRSLLCRHRRFFYTVNLFIQATGGEQPSSGKCNR